MIAARSRAISFFIVFPPCCFLFAVIERIAAFRAEFRRIMRIGGLPAAFIAAVEWRAFRLLGSTVLTEFSFVDRAAGTGPAVGVSRLRRTAFRTEFSCRRRAAGAFPRACLLRFGLFRAALRTEFATNHSSAGAFPAFHAVDVPRRLRLLLLLLLLLLSSVRRT